MKNFLSLIFLLSVEIISAQDTLAIKEIYFDSNLAYQYSNDELFTGVAQKVRKNGHVVLEEVYFEGVILEWRSYFNKSNKRLAEKVFYYEKDPLAPKERIRYITNKNGKFIQRTFYDSYFQKTLVTRHKDTVLVYKCTYKDGRKDGQEFCYDNGVPIITEFINGKKIKN